MRRYKQTPLERMKEPAAWGVADNESIGLTPRQWRDRMIEAIQYVERLERELAELKKEQE